MNWWQAVVLGIVEGLTEYLPVSSTGHLILAQRMLGISANEASHAYAICIQAGAILAVLGLYRVRVMEMLRGLLRRLGWRTGGAAGERNTGWELARNLVVAFLPAALVGLALDDWIERRLFGLHYVVAAWLVGGLAIFAVAGWRRPRGEPDQGKPLDELSWRGALAIGLLQCLAMWPGTSRSLVTIVGGLLVGLSVSAAVEFSFLLGVLTLLAATIYKLGDAGPVMLETYRWETMLLGGGAAWLAAVVAIRWMVTYLKRHGIEIFGYYRVVLGLAVGLALWQGWLAP